MVSDPDVSRGHEGGVHTPAVEWILPPAQKTRLNPGLRYLLVQLHLETGSLQIKWSQGHWGLAIIPYDRYPCKNWGRVPTQRVCPSEVTDRHIRKRQPRGDGGRDWGDVPTGQGLWTRPRLEGQDGLGPEAAGAPPTPGCGLRPPERGGGGGGAGACCLGPSAWCLVTAA